MPKRQRDQLEKDYENTVGLFSKENNKINRDIEQGIAYYKGILCPAAI